MGIIALVSPGNAPGVTTSAFALTLAWPERALLAECSPAGGHLLAGYFQGQLSAVDRGLWHLALQTRHGLQATLNDLGNQVVALDEGGSKRLLPGLRDPFWLVTDDMWEHIGQVFAALSEDVIVDIGQVHVDLPFPLVRHADLVLMVMRPTFAQIAAAKPRLTKLREALADTVPIGLCLVGEGDYDIRAISRESTLGPFSTTVRLPADEKSAEVLAHGAPRRKGFPTARLMREASTAAKILKRSIASAGSGAAGTGTAPGAGPPPGMGPPPGTTATAGPGVVPGPAGPAGPPPEFGFAQQVPETSPAGNGWGISR